MRADMVEALQAHPDFQAAEIGCMEKWNRGEVIYRGILVRHEGVLWLDVQNDGGGANTTTWFRENAADQGWHGTDGKPQGFFDSPAVCGGVEFAAGLWVRELIDEYDRLQ